MEIRVLRYFLAVAREESITKAAELLHLTQPTLSRQISQMEAEGHQHPGLEAQAALQPGGLQVDSVCQGNPPSSRLSAFYAL